MFELKPCPFCGSGQIYKDRPQRTLWEIRCCICCSSSGHHNQRKDAIAAWNRRTVDEKVKAVIDAAKKVVELLRNMRPSTDSIYEADRKLSDAVDALDASESGDRR